jgi:hypothetical protein
MFLFSRSGTQKLPVDSNFKSKVDITIALVNQVWLTWPSRKLLNSAYHFPERNYVNIYKFNLNHEDWCFFQEIILTGNCYYLFLSAGTHFLCTPKSSVHTFCVPQSRRYILYVYPKVVGTYFMCTPKSSVHTFCVPQSPRYILSVYPKVLGTYFLCTPKSLVHTFCVPQSNGASPVLISVK